MTIMITMTIRYDYYGWDVFYNINDDHYDQAVQPDHNDHVWNHNRNTFFLLACLKNIFACLFVFLFVHSFGFKNLFCFRLSVIPSTMYTFRPPDPGIQNSQVHIQVSFSFFLFAISFLSSIFFASFMNFFLGSSTTSGSSPQVIASLLNRSDSMYD